MKVKKHLNYYKTQNSDLKETNKEQKQTILKLQKEISERNNNFNSLMVQIEDILNDKMSVETIADGKYLPAVRQVVQDLHFLGVGVKHIGQTIKSLLKHLVGIENIKLPCKSSNRRMVLESNLLTKIHVAEKMLESQSPNTLHFDGTTDA